MRYSCHTRSCPSYSAPQSKGFVRVDGAHGRLVYPRFRAISWREGRAVAAAREDAAALFLPGPSDFVRVLRGQTWSHAADYLLELKTARGLAHPAAAEVVESTSERIDRSRAGARVRHDPGNPRNAGGKTRQRTATLFRAQTRGRGLLAAGARARQRRRRPLACTCERTRRTTSRCAIVPSLRDAPWHRSARVPDASADGSFSSPARRRSAT